MLTTVSVGGTAFAVRPRYKQLKAVGRGSYGVVVSCVEEGTNEKYAIKRIKPMSAHASDAKHALREIRCMRLLGGHANVIALKDVFANPAEDELYIVMPLLDSDLHRIIQSPQSLTESHHRFFTYQLVRGVKYMHENGVIHRDLKPGNLLVTRNCELQISDFGLARLASVASSGERAEALDAGPMTQHVVTRWYRPPELMLTPDGRYTKSVDMWSVGCILAELLGRKPLFPGKNFVHQLQLIFDVVGSPRPHEIDRVKNRQARKFLDGVRGKRKVPFAALFPRNSPSAADVLECLLVYAPHDRARADALLEHEYLNNLSYAEPRPVLDPPPDLTADLAFETQHLSPAELRRLVANDVRAFELRGGCATASSTSSAAASHARSDRRRHLPRRSLGAAAASHAAEEEYDHPMPTCASSSTSSRGAGMTLYPSLSSASNGAAASSSGLGLPPRAAGKPTGRSKSSSDAASRGPAFAAESLGAAAEKKDAQHPCRASCGASRHRVFNNANKYNAERPPEPPTPVDDDLHPPRPARGTSSTTTTTTALFSEQQPLDDAHGLKPHVQSAASARGHQQHGGVHKPARDLSRARAAGVVQPRSTDSSSSRSLRQQPSARKRTVPVSPKFSKMSWQK